jgi:hypothetical protein
LQEVRIVSDRAYSDADFGKPVAACDIIMKGGITSGIVYPLAITEIAKHYRFANIGGTSAGAIAAAAAAAAEYGRYASGRGFMRLASLPREAGEVLFGLFQPTLNVAPLFAVLVAGLLALLPYPLIRGSVNRIVRRWRRLASRGASALP